MSERPNPFEPPRLLPAIQEVQVELRQIVKQGFAAAHRWPTGGIWMFIILVPIQIQNTIFATVMFESGLFAKLQSGNFDDSNGQPPPELFMLMGFGCFSCFCLLVMLFAIPWIWGGSAGQLRDHLLNAAVRPFGVYGSRSYTTMIGIFVLLMVAVIAVSIPNGIVNQIVSARVVGPFQPMDAETIRALARHPANILSSIVTGLMLAAVGVVGNVVISVTVAVGQGFRAGLTAGFGFCFNNKRAIAKLYVVYILLMLPFVIVSWITQMLAAPIAVGVVVGTISAVYLGYMSIVNFGITAVLYAAKKNEPTTEGAAISGQGA